MLKKNKQISHCRLKYQIWSSGIMRRKHLVKLILWRVLKSCRNLSLLSLLGKSYCRCEGSMCTNIVLLCKMVVHNFLFFVVLCRLWHFTTSFPFLKLIHANILVIAVSAACLEWLSSIRIRELNSPGHLFSLCDLSDCHLWMLWDVFLIH